jgi:hypothetical protein
MRTFNRLYLNTFSFYSASPTLQILFPTDLPSYYADIKYIDEKFNPIAKWIYPANHAARVSSFSFRDVVELRQCIVYRYCYA